MSVKCHVRQQRSSRVLEEPNRPGMQASDEGRRRFRRPLETRVVFLVLGVISAPLAVMTVLAGLVSPFTDEGTTPAAGVLIVAIGVAWGFGVWVCLRGSFLEIAVDGVGVTAVNMFRTKRLPWAEIVGFRVASGAMGIETLLRDGSIVMMNAVTTATRAASAKERLTADEVVQVLADARPGQPPGLAVFVPEPVAAPPAPAPPAPAPPVPPAPGRPPRVPPPPSSV